MDIIHLFCIEKQVDGYAIGQGMLICGRAFEKSASFVST